MAETIEDAWECPVCFKLLSETLGTVKPLCKHKICLPCYSEIRDRNKDPICVLCRKIYWQRPPQAQPVELDYAYNDTYGYNDDYTWNGPEQQPQQWIPMTPEEIASRMARQREPFTQLSGIAIRVIVQPSLTNPNRRILRAAARAANQHVKLSTYTYKHLLMFLRAPAVYAETNTVIPPAAIRGSTHRIRQARILGLQKASEAQRTTKETKAKARQDSKGTVKGDTRQRAVKTFRGNIPPLKGFRLGDIHIDSPTLKGVCVGHHLWRYDNGKYVRKGVVLTPPVANPAAPIEGNGQD